MEDPKKRFKEIWHRIDTYYNLYAKQKGINFTAMLVLEFLAESDKDYTQKALCEKLYLPKQIINSVIKSFWEQGYVELKEAKDRRNKKIHLTEKGKVYAEEVSKPLEEAEEKAWDSLNAEEFALFTRAAEKFERALYGSLKG